MTKLQRQYNEEGIVLLTNGAGANYTSPCKIMYLNTNISLYIKINSKWEIQLNMKPETIKFVKENTEENLWDRGLGKIS